MVKKATPTGKDMQKRAKEIMSDFNKKVDEMRQDGISTKEINNWKNRKQNKQLIKKAEEVLGIEKKARKPKATKEESFYKRSE